MYVISKLSKLERLDGKEILRSERIRAMQMKSKLKDELNVLAHQCKIRKEEQKRMNGTTKLMRSLKSNEDYRCRSGSIDSKIGQEGKRDNVVDESEERTKHCPEDRIKLSNEMYMQKKLICWQILFCLIIQLFVGHSLTTMKKLALKL